jgi:3-hydroxymyristoyl/3-hydroxydecanoyl-(acyl carrier protein) dehydratase
VEAILPYRDPFLLVDRVTWLDLDAGLIVARYDLARAAAVFAGHFPRYPVWPGVLQVEAIGQTGGLLYAIQTHERDRASFALTRIAGARFSRPVTPPGDVEIVARVLDEGLLVNVIGQCLQDGAICSAAAVTFL